MAKSHSKKYRKKHSKKVYGGDAADWVSQVTGAYPHSSQSGTTNLIQQNVPAANMMRGGSSLSPGSSSYDDKIPGAPPAYNIAVTTPGVAPIQGGSGCERRGGSVLSELAVPAVLLIANQKFGKKTGKKYYKKKFSKRRYSRRFRR